MEKVLKRAWVIVCLFVIFSPALTSAANLGAQVHAERLGGWWWISGGKMLWQWLVGLLG